VDGVWCSDGEVGREKCCIQDKICQKAVFSVSSERPVNAKYLSPEQER